MKKWYNKLFLNDIRNAVEKYNMIDNNDSILVGMSGGKDSIFLLYSLMLLKNNSHLEFDITALHIDIGIGIDMTPVKSFCIDNNIDYIEEKTNISEVAFESDKNPCFVCSRLKRGAIARLAQKHNCNKIAFGHHISDAVETMFLNIVFTNYMSTFKPNSFNKEKGISLIRPLIYLEEETITKVVNMEDLPLGLGKSCPFDKKTNREDMKKLLHSIKDKYPDFNKNIIYAWEHLDISNLW